MRVVDLSEAGDGLRDSAGGLKVRDACPDAALFLLEYTDGFRAALLHAGGAGGYVNGWAYAGSLPGGEVHATGMQVSLISSDM